MNETTSGQCSATVRRDGQVRNCRNEGTRLRHGLLWCPIHEPEPETVQWNGPQYRRLVKQGGSRMLSVSNAVPESWVMVEMTWVCEGGTDVVIHLRKVN